MEKKTNSAGLKPVAALVALLVLAAPALALAAGTGGNEGTSDLAYEKAKGAFIAYDSARQNYIQHVGIYNGYKNSVIKPEVGVNEQIMYFYAVDSKGLQRFQTIGTDEDGKIDPKQMKGLLESTRQKTDSTVTTGVKASARIEMRRSSAGYMAATARAMIGAIDYASSRLEKMPKTSDREGLLVRLAADRGLLEKKVAQIEAETDTMKLKQLANFLDNDIGHAKPDVAKALAAYARYSSSEAHWLAVELGDEFAARAVPAYASAFGPYDDGATIWQLKNSLAKIK